jgi:hypothetical protein
MNHQRPTRHHPPSASHIELRVVISNGAPACNTRLKFEFSVEPNGFARVWLVRLPAVKNPDAFVRQVTANCWELRLEVFAETQPLTILNYTPESVAQWLADVFDDTRPPTTELLVLGNNGKFTISIHQPS